MKRALLGALSLAGVFAAVGGVSPSTTPITNTPELVVQGAGAVAPSQQTPQAAKTLRLTAGDAAFLRGFSYRGRSGGIWNGTAKRGNRRGRSRWNYGR